MDVEYSRIGRAVPKSCGNTHAAIVKLLTLSAVEAGTTTSAAPPFRVKALPTIPGVNVTPSSITPVFARAKSRASPSPGHHPTSPLAGVTHCALT